MRIHPIPQCWTLRNWFRRRNQFQFRFIPKFTEFRSIPEFRPIPLWANSRNSVPEIVPAFIHMHRVVFEGQSTVCGCNSGTEFWELSRSGIERDSVRFRLILNSGNWFDPESDEVAGIEPNSGIEMNSWESVRFHRDWIPGNGWNWFRNVQHRRIGWLLL